MAPDIFFPPAEALSLSQVNESSSTPPNLQKAPGEGVTFTDEYSAPSAPVIQPDEKESLQPIDEYGAPLAPKIEPNEKEISPPIIVPSRWVPVQYLQPPGFSPISFFEPLSTHNGEEAPDYPKYQSVISPQLFYTAPAAPVLQKEPQKVTPHMYYTAPKAPVLQQDPPRPSPQTYYTTPETPVPARDPSRPSPQLYYTTPETPVPAQDPSRPSPQLYYTAPEAPVLQRDPSRPSSQMYKTPVQQQDPPRIAPEGPDLQQDPWKHSTAAYFKSSGTQGQQDISRPYPSAYYSAPDVSVKQDSPGASSKFHYLPQEAPFIQKDNHPRPSPQVYFSETDPPFQKYSLGNFESPNYSSTENRDHQSPSRAPSNSLDGKLQVDNRPLAMAHSNFIETSGHFMPVSSSYNKAQEAPVLQEDSQRGLVKYQTVLDKSVQSEAHIQSAFSNVIQNDVQYSMPSAKKTSQNSPNLLPLRLANVPALSYFMIQESPTISYQDYQESSKLQPGRMHFSVDVHTYVTLL